MNVPKSITAVFLVFLLIIISFPIVGTQSAGFSGAKLVRVKYDQGVDSDYDGAFDYLVVGVEIDVSDAGYYDVWVSGLNDSNGHYISVYGSNSSYLGAGLQVLNVSLDGENIYVSKRNPCNVSYVELWGGQYQWEKYNYGSLSNLPLSREYAYTEFDSPDAMLTGKISDRGVDTDNDGAFNYLEIGVEVNATRAGDYGVYVSGLQDVSWNLIDVSGSTRGYVNVGLSFLNVSLSGYTIRSSHVIATYVNYISLSDTYPMYLNHVSLSRKYNYTEFDAPAVLTGVISERGIDTDSDGDFNLFEIGVQINVFDAGDYEVSISGLLDSGFNYIDAYASTYLTLETGLQFVNLTLDGTRIYLSNRNPRYINQLSLTNIKQLQQPPLNNIYINQFSFLLQDKYSYDYYYDSANRVPLSKQYSYTEFDPPGAMLTGKIYDKGVDTDADGDLDFLEVGVEVNVTEAGTYVVSISGLLASYPDKEPPYYPYQISVWDSKTADLSVGVHIVNLYLYGPQIYVSRHDAANVSSINVSDKEYRYFDSRYNVPLSRIYSYTEFDAPFFDVETKFIVYPDGRVALEGTLKHTNMVPRNTGTTATGFFNITGSDGTGQAQAGLTFTFPPELASRFPLNSTTANLLAAYSNGLLNLGINSTMTLPSGDDRYQPYGQWPFNTTDGTVSMTYSGGILNLEINGETTLPPLATSQLPFNATDLTVTGNYADNTLNGRITFSILREIPFDDVNVDFTGTRTDLTLNGTLTVVFGVSLGSLVIRDETELQQLINQLKSTVPGKNGLVWNATGGNLNVTTLDIDYTLQDSWGAKVTFTVKVHGDFVRGLAYLTSGGRNTDLLYPALDEAYNSAKTGSFSIDYKHDTRKAAVELTFAFDLKRFVDSALTPPPGTSTYVQASYSMYPTLAPGDIVFVEPVKNFSDIVADPSNGDIIVFRRPDYDPYYPQIIIHRAINKTQTFGNGTWYFQTKGDNNYAPDSWSLPEHLIIGKVVRRVPLLGYLFFPNLLGYSYYYSNVAVPLQLGDAAFLSIQEASIKLTYSSVSRRFDLKLTLVDKLKELIDEITQKLPGSWPPETLPEAKEFFEKLLNTTYATVSSAQISASYANGIADFQATVNIEGDLNKEVNYVKDLYFQLLKVSYSHMPYNITIPWQLDFIDKTQLDLSNFKVSAQLGETSFEGSVEGITITPPKEIINATHFKLERLFNLTASPYEFPVQNQRLRITVKGGSNATHMVTLLRPPTVPEPDLIAPYSKSMTWSNQTLSSLKGLIFKIGTRLTGTLTIRTIPVSGEVFIDDPESWGMAPQSRVVDVGIYDVTFGLVTGYITPAGESALVYDNIETIVTGEYIPISGRLTITTSPVWGEIFVNGSSWGTAPQSRIVQVGTYTVSFGAIEGFTTPANQVVTVTENAQTTVTGAYQPQDGTAVAEITDPDLVTATNPFIVDAKDDASTHLTITDISDPVTIIVRNMTAPAEAPPPSTWKVLGNCVQITVNNTDVTVNATIRIYYTLDQLKTAGVDESTLKIHYWNATSNQWVAVESHVNTAEHYVWAIINHFSIWAIMGQPAPTTPLWLIFAGIGVLAVVVIVIGVFTLRRRKPQTVTTLKKQ